jgi:hypothetical protein
MVSKKVKIIGDIILLFIILASMGLVGGIGDKI